MRWPVAPPRPPHVVIHAAVAASKYLLAGHGAGLASFQTSLGSAGWPAANQALYIPFELEGPWQAAGGLIALGHTAGGGNWDLGVYTADGTRLASTGSVALAGAIDTEQTVTLTQSVRLSRGVYYMALVASSTGMTIYRYAGGGANDWLVWGALQQASALPLPATATFARNTTQFLPFFSLTGTPL
jgi:hypothetical protein